MALYERSDWTSSGPVKPLTRLAAGEVIGLAIHWPGTAIPYGPTATETQTRKRLETIREFHTTDPPRGRGWSDIAYSVAVDQSGDVWPLRGHRHRSAANGNAALNRQWGAVLLLLGTGDVPTPQMLAAWTAWRTKVWLRTWPHATRIVGHGDIHGTSCPGPQVRGLIRSGRIIPAATPPGDTMPTTDLSPTAVSQIAKATAEACTGAGALHPVRLPSTLIGDVAADVLLPDGTPALSPARAWHQMLAMAAQQACAIEELTADVRALASDLRTLAGRE